MREIRLRNIERRGKLYVISLGNGRSREFTSMRNANYFLAATNSFLSMKLYELFQYYVEILDAYHKNWFYFDNARSNAGLYKREKEIVENLNEVSKLLGLSAERCKMPNGNYLVFTHFNNSLDRLQQTCNIIGTIYHTRSNTDGSYKMEVFLRRIENTKSELNEYPTEKGKEKRRFNSNRNSQGSKAITRVSLIQT